MRRLALLLALLAAPVAAEVVVICDPSHPVVPGAVSFYGPSEHGPAYAGNPNALIDPNLAALSGVPVAEWKCSGSSVVRMTQPERDAIAAARDAATAAQQTVADNQAISELVRRITGPSPPGPASCDEPAESGRIYVERLNPARLWLCGPPWKSSGPACVSFVLWSPCSPTGVANCTLSGAAACGAATNLTAVGAKGVTTAIDMDVFTHCRLRYAGAVAAGQSNAVTVNLRSYTEAADWITSSFNSGTTCQNRTTAVVDLSAKTGVHAVGLQMGVAASDDPLLSGVVLTCCDQGFNF